MLPHEISIVTEQYFWELEAEMGGVGDDWGEVNSVDDECEDEDSANSAVSIYLSIPILITDSLEITTLIRN